jgi:hypothetical protein
MFPPENYDTAVPSERLLGRTPRLTAFSISSTSRMEDAFDNSVRIISFCSPVKLADTNDRPPPWLSTPSPGTKLLTIEFSD